MFTLPAFLAINLGASIVLSGMKTLFKQKATIIGSLVTIAIVFGLVTYNITGMITLVNQGVSNTGWITLGLFAFVSIIQAMGLTALISHGVGTAIYYATTTPEKRAYDRAMEDVNKSLNNLKRSMQNG